MPPGGYFRMHLVGYFEGIDSERGLEWRCSDCRAGNCGTCITAIKSGEVSYVGEPGAEPEAGSCLTCISVPKSKLTLDA